MVFYTSIGQVTNIQIKVDGTNFDNDVVRAVRSLYCLEVTQSLSREILNAPHRPHWFDFMAQNFIVVILTKRTTI